MLPVPERLMTTPSFTSFGSVAANSTSMSKRSLTVSLYSRFVSWCRPTNAGARAIHVGAVAGTVVAAAGEDEDGVEMSATQALRLNPAAIETVRTVAGVRMSRGC